MKKFVRSTVLSLVAALLVAGCAPTAKTGKDAGIQPSEGDPAKKTAVLEQAAYSADEEVVAIINGRKIFKNDFDGLVKVNIKSMEDAQQHGAKVSLTPNVMKGVRNKSLAQLIDGELLYQESIKYPFEELEKKFETQYANIIKSAGSEDLFLKKLEENNLTVEIVRLRLRKNMTIQNYIDNVLLNSFEITEDDMREYYNTNISKYEALAKVSARHILIKVVSNATDEQKAEALAKMKKVEDMLKAGEDFARVARSHSEGPSSLKGGNLGTFTRKQMVKPFADAAFSAKIGEVTDIVTTKFGYHIILVEKYEMGQTKGFSEVKADIENILRQSKLHPKIAEILNKRRSEMKVEILIKK